MKKIISLAIVLMLLMSLVCSAALPAAPNDYTYDAANVISSLTKDVIRVNNEALQKATGAMIEIVTVRSTGNDGSADYAYKLMNSWGVGDKNLDNGVMFLLALRGGDDNGYALITGTGAERIISPQIADDLLTDYFDPYYATMDYDYGVLSLFEAVFCKLRDYYGLNLAFLDAQAVAKMTGTDYSAYDRAPAPASEGGSSMGYIIAIVIILIVISSMGSRRRRRRGGVAVPPPPVRRAPRVVVRPAVRPRPFGGSRPMGGGFGSSRPSGGFGGSRSSGGSRGSFGGFGGGSSRGGGASRGR